MHTTTLASLLPVALSLLSLAYAAPTSYGSTPAHYPSHQTDKNCTEPTTKLPKCEVKVNDKQQYHVCGTGSGFRGWCSESCSSHWCPDYQPDTCIPLVVDPPGCSGPDCDETLPCTDCGKPPKCPDCDTHTTDECPCKQPTKPKPCTTTTTPTVTPTCTTTPTTTPTCTPTPTPKPKEDCDCEDEGDVKVVDTDRYPPPTHGELEGQLYVCRSNGFQGRCSINPCAQAWCPDYIYKTYKPAPKYPGNDGDGYVYTTATGYKPAPTGY